VGFVLASFCFLLGCAFFHALSFRCFNISLPLLLLLLLLLQLLSYH